jgi:hypothetical protein
LMKLNIRQRGVSPNEVSLIFWKLFMKHKQAAIGLEVCKNSTNLLKRFILCQPNVHICTEVLPKTKQDMFIRKFETLGTRVDIHHHMLVYRCRYRSPPKQWALLLQKALYH